MSLRSTGWRLPAGVLATAALMALCAHGAWWLAPLLLVPWLGGLDAGRGAWRALAGGWALAVAFVLAVLPWFGIAIGRFTGWGSVAGLLVLVAIAPLLQPQFIAHALARDWAGRRWDWGLRALFATCAWLACEWLWPKLLGDTLGHGVVPSRLLRQLADVGGVPAITGVLLMLNELLARAFAQRRAAPRAWAMPLAGAALVLAGWAGYGALRVAQFAAPPAAAAPLRVGLVQSNITDYETLRRQRGAYAVVREVLDVHFALSMQAVREQRADALLWSETMYPTPFGFPRSAAGAELDGEIAGFVDAAGVPLLFGSYDVDTAGEYNAAVLLEPERGVLGRYRKSRPFPLTEHVPAWLDRPWLRRVLPWTGTWQRGDGARVLPLRLRDGREVPVQPLICLDDVDPRIALDGARLGAQLLLGMSNDSWFSADGSGARLHLAVARMRSVETRLPQLRVTANGISAVIDATGEITAKTGIGERALLVGEVAPRPAAMTHVLRAGQWVGPLALGVLLMLLAAALWRRVVAGGSKQASAGLTLPEGAWLLTPAARAVVASLQLATVLGLVAVALRWMQPGVLLQSPALLRLFGCSVVLPWAVAALLLWRQRTRLQLADGVLALQQRRRRIEVPRAAITGASTWRWPLPMPGVDLQLASGARLPQGLGGVATDAVAAMLGVPTPGAGSRVLRVWGDARCRVRGWRIDHPLIKFALFALVPAWPAFRLHQHIAYGGTFGEWLTFGPQAWWLALGLWWAGWAVALVLLAVALRALVELVCLGVAWHAPGQATLARRWLEAAARLLYFVGLPAWMGLRLLLG